MSEANLELVRRLYRAMDERDIENPAQLADPDLEWVPDTRVGEAPVRGREQVIRFFEDRTQMFGEIRTEIERLWDTGDKVLAFIRVSGSGQSSGAAVEVRIAHIHARARGSGLETDFQTGGLVEFRDGLIVRWEDFGSKEKALEAAGLRV